MMFDLNNTYIIRFYHDINDEWVYLVNHKSERHRYLISSTKNLKKAKVFKYRENAELCAALIQSELLTQVCVYKHNGKKLFNAILSGK